MKIFNRFKKIVVTMMALGVILTSGSIRAYASEMTSGIYEIENDVYHESETGMAMARTYLLPTMTVEVTSENIIYTVGFSGSEFMENYRMKLNDTDLPIEIVQDGSEDGVVKLNIEVDKVDADMDALIYVGPMERDVQFKVIPKMETLTLIEEIVEENIEEVQEIDVAIGDGVKSELSTEVEVTEKVEDIISEDESSVTIDNEKSSNTKIIAAGSVLVLAVVAIVAVKGKKKNA